MKFEVPELEEYRLLQDELKQLNSRRFTIIGVTILVITFVFVMKQITSSIGSGYFTAFIFLIMTGSSMLLWITGIWMTRIETFLEYFYESDLKRFNRKMDFISFTKLFNALVGALYLIINSFASGNISSDFSGVYVGVTDVYVFLMFSFLVSIFLLVFFSNPRFLYSDKWKKIQAEIQKESENKTAKTST